MNLYSKSAQTDCPMAAILRKCLAFKEVVIERHYGISMHCQPSFPIMQWNTTSHRKFFVLNLPIMPHYHSPSIHVMTHLQKCKWGISCTSSHNSQLCFYGQCAVLCAIVTRSCHSNQMLILKKGVYLQFPWQQVDYYMLL